MKQQLMYTLLGMIMTTVMYAMMPSALAAVSKQIQVTYNNIKVVVDGKELYMTDSANKRIEPFVSDGSTYLPVNAIAKAFDKPIQFDNKTQTLYIGKMPEGKPAAWLSEITPISSQRKYHYGEPSSATVKSVRVWNQAGDLDNTDEHYRKGLFFNLNNDVFVSNIYYLKMNYKELHGKIVIHNNSKNQMDTVKVAFYRELDDKWELIYQTKPLQNDTLPYDINVSVQNVDKLKVSVESCIENGQNTDKKGKKCWSTANVGFVEPALYQ